MSGTQTICRALALGSAPAVLAFLASCDFEGRGPRRSAAPHFEAARPARAAQPEAGAQREVAKVVPSAVAQTLRSVRERRLELSPPSSPPQRLAFGAGRLLQACDEKAVFRDTTQGDVVAEANVGAVRAVAHGSDGALFALGASAGARLEPHAKSPTQLPAAAFFPGSLLFGDLAEPSHFFVFYQGAAQLYRYPFEVEGGALLPIEGQASLEGCTGAVLLLRDGAFLCRTQRGYARQVPLGRRTELKSLAELAEPLRLVAAKRLDEFFSVSRAGEVWHLRFTPNLPVLGHFQLPAPPYAASANAEALAFVLVSPPADGPRRWRLLVTDFEGQPRFQAELSAHGASADDNWLEAVTEDKNLAISEYGPLVAVGGSSLVTVWDYGRGQIVFAR